MAIIKQHFDIDVAQFRSATPFPTFTKTDGTNGPVTMLAFDATIEQTAFFRTRATNYGSGNLTVTLNWNAASATSGGVSWGVSVAAITPNTDSQDVETKSFATEVIIADTHIGTTAKRAHDAVGTVVALDSLAVDDLLMIRVARKTGDAGDTMAGFANLIMLDVAYSDT
jgi:hypothetical protein